MNRQLSFSNVSFAYEGQRHVLQQLSFSVENGEFVSIIGPSGCGKSTLFRLILGLEQGQEGDILTQKQAGYMPQQDSLLPWRTAAENAALSLECQGAKKKEAVRIAGEYFAAFGLDGYHSKYPKDLSGGMRQRVSFLRTFLTGADLLLLDEPFSALDAITKVKMQEWLHEQQRKWEKTVLFITHDVEEALFLSQRIFVITETPIRHMREVVVPLPAKRERHDLSRPELVSLKEELLELLKEGVRL
ncbi:ABC transporter ATP-binding protein [Ectobacillus ponti]|uniref:ABC transporter ATP-binding protein n=1 Tax=Ectobacillus ponti TaxID=2961894 RepID=A0AA42BS68_9BACI|nr:ABC transporter ATP-binding protein [Ectobacillus ponti]MCP8968128.1 ABC transporter ATP-binding protein [Ectobacillus ponti]